ncbi:hypothetical protein ACF3MZ_16095 [Paenibacillaceae bacterium WGS1546]|uniref:hypothetical protein n=1 Tax=Cohnella sp. WGS1546 TaxID=3366810 RepID=UPI00372D239A
MKNGRQTQAAEAAPRTYSGGRRDRVPSAPVPTRSVESAKNGSMVQDFADMRRLGRDMERVRTERQLREEGLASDPSQ